jgi:CRISPR/Cas system-associated exonuclease Cas4 (RecB family)
MASKYKKELDAMMWSFSRLSTYTRCPYKFYLIYIEQVKKERKFHAEYGKFIHSILEKYFKREFNEQECLDYYIENFDFEVTSYIKESTKEKLFMAGVDYFSTLEWEDEDFEILMVEGEVKFTIGKFNFIGYIDVLLRDKNTKDMAIVLRDHKSGESPIGKRGGVLKNKEEEYRDHKRQLYLYSIAIYDKYGVYPKYLEWNYPRNKTRHRIEFNEAELEDAKNWALDNIKKIYKDKSFNPFVNYVNCYMLCDVCDNCEYRQFNNDEE